MNPSKKGLHFLGFLWPNKDFSMGYSESKIKKSFLVRSSPSAVPRPRASGALVVSNDNTISAARKGNSEFV
jgi:hypothetical protein